VIAETGPVVRAPRDIIGKVLADLAEEIEDLVVIDADLGRSTRLGEFERRFPARFVQVGVAEQNALGIATGLAYTGYLPVFVDFAMFAVGLGWTQLRQAAYAGVRLKVIGTHPGFDAGPDGGTHQMLEDLALARSLPGVSVLMPCDTPEVDAAIRAGLALEGVSYIRVGRYPVPDLHEAPPEYPLGRAELIRDAGRDCVLVADGSMVWPAMQAADLLESRGIHTSVVNTRWLKPFDDELIIRLGREATALVTVENHSIVGGLGGLIAEVLAQEGRPFLRLGSNERFGESGPIADLRRKHCLDADCIAARCEAWWRERRS
jgi:transketolase